MDDVLLKNLPESSLPRERFLKYGGSSLSDEELLAIILRCGYKNVNVKMLSTNILKEIKSLENLKDMTIKELSSIKGIGLTKAITILSALELGKRVYLDYSTKETKLNNSKLIYDYFKSQFFGKKQELFYVAYLDHKKSLIGYEMIFKGTLDSSTVHPREIFKGSVKNSASSIVLMHNHPSNDSRPSIADIEFTKNIKELGDMMGISVIDHIIFTNKGYYSFFENDLMRK